MLTPRELLVTRIVLVGLGAGILLATFVTGEGAQPMLPFIGGSVVTVGLFLKRHEA